MEEKQREKSSALGTPSAAQFGQQLTEQLDDAKSRLKDVDRRLSAYIKERPMQCLVGAVAVGFLLGRLLRSR